MPTIKQIKTPDNTTYDIHGVDDTAYHTDDTELTSASSLANSDYIPIYDTSDTASKKFKISNLVTRLKTLLDLGNAAYKDIKHTYDSSNEDAISGKGVAAALATLPEPMIFKGSLGTGGTITTLPTASSSNKGYTYKVITEGDYASQHADVGDTFISDGTAWVLIPSGDEPSGTVTSVKITATSPIAVSSTSAITTSGTRTISHETSGATAGSYGDSGNQTPTYGGTFKVPYITVNDTGHVTGISAHTVKIPSSDNTNTTYSFADGTNQFTVTPSDGSASTIKVTPQLKIDGITSDATDKEINCYGECSTAAGTAAKTVSITKGTFALAAGSKVIVKFTNANTANNPTLNVNSKGAKNIFHNGARITTGTNKALLAGTVEFVYDGTQFQLVGNYIDTDTTYSAGTGISFDGTTINHSNSVTAGTAKGDNSKTLTFGGTFAIPSVTYDAQGHVTAKGTTTMTMPANPNTDTKVTQTNNTDDKYYRVLLSSTDNNNEDTNTVNKSGEITVNPSTGRFRCKRFAVENNEAYTVYPIYVKLTGRDAATAGQDVKLMQVQYKTTNSGTDYTHTAYPIAVIGNNVGNTNNTGVRLGSVNGTTIVGAGESADDFATAQAKYNDENLYLTADGRVYIYQGLSNAADSYSTKIQFPNQIVGADSSISNGVATVAMQRSCLAGNDSAVDGTKRWYKVATWNVLTTNTDVAAMIAVNNTYSNGVSGNENAGILHVHFRQNALGTHAHAALKFIANSGFNTQHFKLVWEYYYNLDLQVAGLSYCLYTYIDVRYMRRRFAFLSEGYRTNNIDYTATRLMDSTNAEVEPTTSSGPWINGIYAS